MSKSLEDIIRKVEALLTQADHPNTGPEEAAVFRAKAEAMMLKYRIEEISLNLSGEATAPESLTPQWEDIVLSPMRSPYSHFYMSLFGAVVRHFDAKHLNDVDDGNYVAHVVGYPSDLRFIKMVWQSIRLEFSRRLEPEYDPSLSDEENCYRMRAAGFEGARIAYAVFKDASKGNRVKARKLARRYAEKIGEDPRTFSGQGNSMKVYRESYASGFLYTIQDRLRTMQRSRNIGEAGALVLASRKEDIEEAFYERYPHMRPKPAVESAARSSWDEQRDCPKCQKAKSGYCREHAWMRPKMSRGSVSYNYGAANAGSAAARAVDLGITNREVR